MKEIVIEFGFYCFVIIVAAIVALKTRMEGVFFILTALGIIIVQNVFIRWALMAQQEKAEAALQESSRIDSLL